MLTLYITRHGETEWNKEKRMQGRLDSGLTEKGKERALLLGKRLKDIHFSRVISSPSKRTMDTTKLIMGDADNKVETDERLLEIALGEWQGKTADEIKALYPAQHDAYWNQPNTYENHAGERFQDVVDRIGQFLHDIEKSQPNGHVLVVTHGVVIKALYLLCRQKTIDHIWAPPFVEGTSLTIVQIENGKTDLVVEACLEHCS
ncbi:histidine phosphatase family protein [Cytobacillus purgationiresistens]|uniref:Phosphoglycerate mutase n=1 Tax=Cytobacillus purgationiresistens TaxID=863449 RepID=A0ABU0AT63_9BACI|nr:histidine phosphatase family protein [Cytobacillus purgationiresistens]MDQ0273230.1 putative phosphoglycerate mutase [Cytobacillus purgationiresistens]